MATATATKRVKKIAIQGPNKGDFVADYGYAAVVDPRNRSYRFEDKPVDLASEWSKVEVKAATDDRQWIVTAHGRGDYRVAYRSDVLASFVTDGWNDAGTKQIKVTNTIKRVVYSSYEYLVLDDHTYVVLEGSNRLGSAITEAEALIDALGDQNPLALTLDAAQFAVAYDKAQVEIVQSQEDVKRRNGDRWRRYWNLSSNGLVGAFVKDVTSATTIPGYLVVRGLEDGSLTLVGDRPAETLVTVVVRREDDRLNENEVQVWESTAVVGNATEYGTIVHLGTLQDRLQERLTLHAAAAASTAVERRERLVKNLQTLRDRAQTALDQLAEGDVWRLTAFERLNLGDEVEEANSNCSLFQHALQEVGSLADDATVEKIRKGEIDRYDVRRHFGLKRNDYLDY